MRKYLQVMKMSWQEAIMYKANFFITSVVDVFRILAEVAFWGIYFEATGKRTIAGYDFSTMITYYILMFLIRTLMNTGNIGTKVAEDIKLGKLSQYLIKPINYFGYYYLKELSRKSLEIGVTMLVFVPVFIFGSTYMVINVEAFHMLVYPIVLMLAFTLSYFLNIVISLSAFWLIEVTSIFFLKDITLDFLSGGIFPLDIIPKIILRVFNLLPFMYIIFSPIKIINKGVTNTELLLGMSAQVFWIIVLFLLAKFLWKKGIRHYSGTGI